MNKIEKASASLEMALDIVRNGPIYVCDQIASDEVIAAIPKIIEGTDAERAKLRPANYLDLEPCEQWAIDKRLGILDWDGCDVRRII
jgi:hypothetical protein